MLKRKFRMDWGRWGRHPGMWAGNLRVSGKVSEIRKTALSLHCTKASQPGTNFNLQLLFLHLLWLFPLHSHWACSHTTLHLCQTHAHLSWGKAAPFAGNPSQHCDPLHLKFLFPLNPTLKFTSSYFLREKSNFLFPSISNSVLAFTPLLGDLCS